MELLKLLRENLHSDFFRDGLCHLIDDMLIIGGNLLKEQKGTNFYRN